MDKLDYTFLAFQAYQYKQLLEKNICDKARVADYAEMMRISRVSLNKAVIREFGLSAVHLLKQRLLQEVKNDLSFPFIL